MSRGIGNTMLPKYLCLINPKGSMKTASTNNKKPFRLHPKLLGAVYIMLGIIGLGFAFLTLFSNLKDIYPVFGATISGAFVGALSVLILIYGYRVFSKDYTPFI